MSLALALLGALATIRAIAPRREVATAPVRVLTARGEAAERRARRSRD